MPKFGAFSRRNTTTLTLRASKKVNQSISAWKVGVKQRWFDTTLEKVGRGKLAPWFCASAVNYRVTFLSVILPVTSILGLIELKIALHFIRRPWKPLPKTKHEVDRIRSYTTGNSDGGFL